MRSVSWAHAVSLAAALLLVPASARLAWAQPTASESAERKNVELAIAGDPEENKLLEDTLRELVARLGLRVVGAQSNVAQQTILARVVVFGEKDHVEVVVADGRDGSILLKRSIVRDPSPAITREEIAHEVRSAVEAAALREEKPPPPTPPPATLSPAKEPGNAGQGPAKEAPKEKDPIATSADRDQAQPTPRAPSAVAVDVGTFAAGGPVGDGSGAVFRFGAGAAVASRRGLRPHLGAAIEYALPFESEGALVGARTNLVAARLRPGLGILRTSGFALDAAVGGGLDVFTVAPRSATLPSSALAPGTTHADVVVSGAVTAKIAIVSSVALTVAATLDVDPVARAYILEQPGADERVLALWRVRPAIAVGFAFTAFGESAFAEGR